MKALIKRIRGIDSEPEIDFKEQFVIGNNEE